MKQKSDRDGDDAPSKLESETALAERLNDSFGFDRINRIGATEIANSLARHTPRKMARAAVAMLNFAVSGDAKTFSSSLMSFDLRHLRPLAP